MPNERPKLDPDRFPIHSAEGGRHKIAWMREFREMLREHPGIIKVTIELADRAIDEYNPPNFQYGLVEFKYDRETARWMEERESWPDETGKTRKRWEPMPFGRGTILVPGSPTIEETLGLEIVVLGRSNRELGEGPFGIEKILDKCDYFKISVGNKAFFVKRSTVSTNPGFKEFQSTLKAKEVLRGLDFVRVIDAQLGYQDKEQSWYVSNWEELEASGFISWDALEVTGRDDYGRDIREKYDPATEDEIREYGEVKDKVRIITSRLQEIGIGDIDNNLFYNPRTQAFIFLDATSRSRNDTIGSPRREEETH